MRISSVAKKATAVTLAMAVAAGTVAVVPAQDASAAKAKAKKVTARVYFAGTTQDADCVWVKGDGSTAPKLTKTLSLKKGKKTKVSFTIAKPASHVVSGKKVKIKKMTGATVLVVDLVNYLKSFKKAKISGATVKADGKKVKIKKVYTGAFESNKASTKYNYRVSFYNTWGNKGLGDLSSTNNAKAFAFKKNLTVSFTVTPK